MDPLKPRKWQNLIHGKCPSCDVKMVRDRKVYACDICHYYITPSLLLEYLADTKSLIWQNMTPKERQQAREIMAGKC